MWHDETRFKVVPSGRHSGKTELAKRRLVEHLFRRTRHGLAGRYFAAAPTDDQAKRVFWEDLKALVPRRWVRSIHQVGFDLMHRLAGDAERVAGLGGGVGQAAAD